MWHGTGWYYNNLSQVGLAFLLSKVTETTWKEYIEKVQGGELSDGDLLWNTKMHETDYRNIKMYYDYLLIKYYLMYSNHSSFQ